ncbi:hypothetical protein Dip510_002056 [Elusimicrobium posterum]|uniref:hypothetical protein n=1 Tax=Elusimicrobium posterum TaxID=3116653 RepID=UPI003C781F5B
MPEIKNNKEDHNRARRIRTAFLKSLKNSPTIEEALSKEIMSYEDFVLMYAKDGAFRKKFDDIVNIKLELALLDSALKSKSPPYFLLP